MLADPLTLRCAVSAVLTQHTQTKTPTPRISAVFGQDNVSLSGNGSALEQFKTIVSPQTPSAHFRSPHVHGYYHGGIEMAEVVEQVIRDTQTRGIWFPTWQCMRTSVRSAATGVLMAPSTEPDGPSLLEVALRSILVDTVTWQQTMNSLTTALATTLDEDPDERFRLIGMGPNASSLVRNAKTAVLPAQVVVIDQFSEHIRENPSDAYAIVGLSVNYPSGNGQEEFWATMESGTSTLSSVCCLPTECQSLKPCLLTSPPRRSQNRDSTALDTVEA